MTATTSTRRIRAAELMGWTNVRAVEHTSGTEGTCYTAINGRRPGGCHDFDIIPDPEHDRADAIDFAEWWRQTATAETPRWSVESPDEMQPLCYRAWAGYLITWCRPTFSAALFNAVMAAVEAEQEGDDDAPLR